MNEDVKEILSQLGRIIKIHEVLVEYISRPPVVYHDPENIKLKDVISTVEHFKR